MKKKERIFKGQSTSKMRLYMIIFIACLSYSKSIELFNTSNKYLDVSRIPVIRKLVQSTDGTATTTSEAPNNSTQTESPPSTQTESSEPTPTNSSQDAHVDMMESNEEINTTLGNDLLELISQESDEPNEAVEEVVDLLFSWEYWRPVTSKLQYVWGKVKQAGRYAGKTLRKVTSYIKKQLKQFRVYINQGREITETLHNAVKSAGEVTKDSDEPTIKNINNFFVQLIYILKNFKDLFKPDPIEIASDRDSLAE